MSINAYITPHEYLRESTGQETQSLIGNLMKLTGSGVVLGGTSLPIAPNTTVNLAVNDPVYIFDGPNTEIVFVSSTTNAGASSIPVSATQYAHAGGTSCITDGRLGSLGELIIEGSASLERITRQPLLQATYTNETLPLLTTRAVINNKGALMVRPMQFPVTAVAALALQFDTFTTMTLDAAQALIQSGGKLFNVPVVKATSATPNYTISGFIDPTTEGNVVLTYTAGYAYSQLPYIVKRCAVWLTSDLMSDRANPDGAAETKQGEQQIVAYLRGDLSGESALVKRARKFLSPYTQGAY